MSRTWMVACACLASSCVYLPRVVRLVPPEAPATAQPACIEVEPLVDAREAPERIGVVRNGLYWPTASVRTDDAAAQWVTAFFRAALGVSPASAPACALVLKGALRELFVDEYFNLDGRVRVSLRLERQGVVLLERDFEGSHSQLSNFGSESEFEETLRRTLEAVGHRAVPAIVESAAAAQPVAVGL